MSNQDEQNIVEPGEPESITKVEYTGKEYREHFKQLVELERKEEMERHEAEIKKLSGWERQKKGRAILNARARDEGTALGGKFIVKFVRKDGLPETEISVGDLIRVSKNHPLSDDNPSGTVTEITGYSLKVAFEEKPPGWIYDNVRIDLYVNDITYQRMLDAIEKTSNLKGEKRKLFNKLISKEELESSPTDDIYFINRDLNESQKSAVRSAIESQDLYLIHGPPGTGKTVTCVEIIEQAMEAAQRVLACADSNTAVDNLVEHLVSHGKDVVRVGHPARVNPVLREHTLDYILEDNGSFQKAQELRQEALDLKDKQDDYTYPSGRWRRGLSNESIKSLAKKGKGSRGVPPDKIKEMARSLEIQEKVDELFEKVDHLEDKAVNEVLDSAEVVCSTNSSSASQALENRNFDLCVIDEATQATEPSCLIPALKARKLVMAGDHKQLPPTILNQEASEKGLSETLFERMIALYGMDIKKLLKVQYRMHEDIMKFSDDEFYEGRIKADESVREHTLSEIITSPSSEKFEKVLDPGEPIVFLDTLGNFRENSRTGSTSKKNPGEAVLAKEIVEELLRMGVDTLDIGVITPYDDQKDLISSKINNEEIEVDTVDGFQGREKEVIILSLTRSNQENDIGFLKDLRRLNVSITRAKRKLIMIGDSGTVSTDEVFRKMIDYVKQVGELVEVKSTE